MKDKPIKETLKNMEVGAEERFPLSRYSSIRNSQYNTLVEERANGMKWEVRADLNQKCTIVRRIS